jgi:hypothetical protein
MHHAPRILAALILAGCAGQGWQEAMTPDPVVGQPAGAAPAACDPAVKPALTVSDSGACPGIMPVPPACAAQIAACEGVKFGIDGPRGSMASAATSDARGALAIACEISDVGPPLFFSLHAPMATGYADGIPLGEDVLASFAGFVARSNVPGNLLFFDHSGAQTATAPRGVVFVGPAAVEIAAVVSGSVVLQQYSFDGEPRGALQTVGSAAGAVFLDGATDALGHTLVAWGTEGTAGTMARWFAPDGTPESDAFQLPVSPEEIGGSAALPGTGIAIGSSVGPRWRLVITAGSTIPAAAPEWLAARQTGFTVIRGGRALAFGNDILSTDGKPCGSLHFGRAALLGIGLDGSAVTTDDGATVTVYPRLLQ